MAQKGFRFTPDVLAALNAGRAKQPRMDETEYVSALILDGANRVSGLDKNTVHAAVVVDMRVGGAITSALTELRRSLEFTEVIGSPAEACIAESIERLKFAQGVIIEAQAARMEAIDAITDQRLRIRGGSNNWAKAEKLKGRDLHDY